MYLIRPDWISGEPGGSKAPTAATCAAAMVFLTDLGDIVKALQSKPAPKLVMGPIPTGGVSIEIHQADCSFSANFLNEGSIEVEVVKNGVFQEARFTEGAQSRNELLTLLKNAFS